MQSFLAIVILNYNGEKFLKKFLPSVIRHSEGHRIIVADNASTDGSVSLLQEQFPEVEILQLLENFGFAGGYNQALKLIKAKYFLLLNSDVEVTNGWLAPMLSLLESFPEIAACQPKIRAYHRPEYFEYAGAAGGFLDILGYPFCRGRLFDTLEKDEGQYNEPIEIFWATGACMLIKAEVFWKSGGFDARFFAHMEEIDLCWRIHRLGYKVFACPESIVYHVGGGTLAKSNPKKTYLNFRNSLWMLFKNSHSSDLVWKLPSRIALDLLAAIQFIAKGKTNDALSVGKAHYSFWRQLPKKEKTDFEFNKRIIPFYPQSILWEYYGKQKKKFSELNYQLKKEEGEGKIQKAM